MLLKSIVRYLLSGKVMGQHKNHHKGFLAIKSTSFLPKSFDKGGARCYLLIISPAHWKHTLYEKGDHMPIRVGINGFGRIGRSVFRAALQGKDFSQIEI